MSRFNSTMIPTAYLSISDALATVELGMFGGMRRPAIAGAIKAKAKELGGGYVSVGLGARKIKAAQVLDRAISTGKIDVLLLTSNTSSKTADVTPLPSSILRRLIRTRGTLPDRPIRPSLSLLREGKISPAVYSALLRGVLVVRGHQFRTWYRRERAKGNWPSQGERIKKPIGAPKKLSAALKHSIIALLYDGEWSAQMSVAKLARLLAHTSAASEIPSHDSLSRYIDSLYAELGDDRLRRRPRRHRSTR